MENAFAAPKTLRYTLHNVRPLVAWLVSNVERAPAAACMLKQVPGFGSERLRKKSLTTLGSVTILADSD